MKKLTILQSTAPREIWLQVSDEHQDNAEPFPKDAEGVTWCQDSVLACEVRYVRVRRHITGFPAKAQAQACSFSSSAAALDNLYFTPVTGLP